jgi:hypothetical protein
MRIAVEMGLGLGGTGGGGVRGVGDVSSVVDIVRNGWM